MKKKLKFKVILDHTFQGHRRKQNIQYDRIKINEHITKFYELLYVDQPKTRISPIIELNQYFSRVS